MYCLGKTLRLFDKILNCAEKDIILLICQRAVAKKNRIQICFEKKIDAVISKLSFSHLYNLHIQRSSEKLFYDLHYKHIFRSEKCVEAAVGDRIV